MCKQLPQISTRNRNSQHFSRWNQRHWKLGFHAINHWVIFHSLFYMFLVSNKQLVFTACSSHPFAVHKLSAGHFRTTSAIQHRKTQLFLYGGCKSCLNSLIKYFWHPIYILYSQTSSQVSQPAFVINKCDSHSEHQSNNNKILTKQASKHSTGKQVFHYLTTFLKGHPPKISNLIYKSFSVIIFKTDIEYFWREK